MMSDDVVDKFRMLIGEMSSHRRHLVEMFMVISLAAVLIGINFPKVYVSSTNMYVEYKNIIDPLMEGTAVRADIADLAANAKEIILGRSNLTEVLKRDGVLTGRLSSAEEDELLKELMLTADAPRPCSITTAAEASASGTPAICKG
jgi:hypothetical protein